MHQPAAFASKAFLAYLDRKRSFHPLLLKTASTEDESCKFNCNEKKVVAIMKEWLCCEVTIKAAASYEKFCFSARLRLGVVTKMSSIYQQQLGARCGDKATFGIVLRLRRTSIFPRSSLPASYCCSLSVSCR